MSDIDGALTIIAGIVIVIGIFGTFIPFVPGLVLSWAGVLLWALFVGEGVSRWVVLGVATVLALGGSLLKFLIPGRRMKRGGVPVRALLLGGVLGIIGFFVVPVVGLFLGFVLGVFLAEMARLHRASEAWPSTWKAMKGVGLSMVIEIFTGMCILATWIIGAFVL
jgi:uncharacterized protein YqgC (DUF456 family)